MTQTGAVPFTKNHIQRITPILEFYWSIDPRGVHGIVQIVSQDRDGFTD